MSLLDTYFPESQFPPLSTEAIGIDFLHLSFRMNIFCLLLNIQPNKKKLCLNVFLQTFVLLEVLVCLFFFFFFFWPCLQHQHGEVPGPGIKLAPQRRPEPQQWQCQILNPLSHQGTPLCLLEKNVFSLPGACWQLRMVGANVFQRRRGPAAANSSLGNFRWISLLFWTPLSLTTK